MVISAGLMILHRQQRAHHRWCSYHALLAVVPPSCGTLQASRSAADMLLTISYKLKGGLNMLLTNCEVPGLVINTQADGVCGD